MQSGLKDKTAIAGIGATEFSKASGRSELRLAVEAISLALDDCGLEPSDVDGMCAFTMENAEARGAMLSSLFDKEVIALGAGERSVRFRLPLVISASEVEEIITRVASCMPASVGA